MPDFRFEACKHVDSDLCFPSSVYSFALFCPVTSAKTPTNHTYEGDDCCTTLRHERISLKIDRKSGATRKKSNCNSRYAATPRCVNASRQSQDSFLCETSNSHRKTESGHGRIPLTCDSRRGTITIEEHLGFHWQFISLKTYQNIYKSFRHIQFAANQSPGRHDSPGRAESTTPSEARSAAAKPERK